ncbi:MAG: hypothetical protein NTV84_05925, partial [Methanoregula sp.]|nr:hypothetical protein [Methanoregula sp.]
MKPMVYLICILALIAITVIPVSAAGDPTVTVTDYRVNPSVLMPGSFGTIAITIKNTASSATLQENVGSGSTTSGTT